MHSITEIANTFCDSCDYRITPAAAAVFERTLARGLVQPIHLSRTFASLSAAGRMPAHVDERFARHFAMWLEVINQPYFKPIITSPGRLNRLMEVFAAAASYQGDGLLVDFGTGQPPYTTMDLADRFPHADIHGIDLYEPTALVRRADGSYVLFEGDRLAAAHAPRVETLHHMVMNWAATERTFESLLRHSNGDAEVIHHPGRALKQKRRVTFHKGEIGFFGLPSFDGIAPGAIWSFNCLLHYPLNVRLEALRSWIPRLAPGAFVMEGYTSPSGAHAVYCLWQLLDRSLQLQEFGFTPNNFHYPLWPLHERDPQVEIMNAFISRGGPECQNVEEAIALVESLGYACHSRNGLVAIAGESFADFGQCTVIEPHSGGYPSMDQSRAAAA